MQRHKYSFEALGTLWSIETNDKLSLALKATILARIELFDATYSRFRKDSLVTQVSKQPGTYEFPDDAQKLFGFYEKLYNLTDGKVTPLIGDVISRAGYDADYSFIPHAQFPTLRWGEILSLDGSALTVKEPTLLDVGAAGKGYMIDIVCGILDDNAVVDYVVDASGDLRHKGATENEVGLEHPFDPTKVIGAVDVQNKSLCASAINKRSWGEGIHHIFDPDTTAPSQEIVATWVIADEAMVADGLATALFFTEPRTLKTKYDFEYVRITAKGTVEYSPYFEGKLF